MTARRSFSVSLVLALGFACKTGEDDESGAGTDATGTDTTGTDTTGSDTTGTDTTGSDTTDTTTGIDTSGFERFRLARAAGPCPPDLDCDGFIELVAPATLRVEEFGDITNTVNEVEVSAEDAAAAILVFSDPELWALLDQPELPCNPPTDVFESMLVDFEGITHDSPTTACVQPPITAARDMANALATEYLP